METGRCAGRKEGKVMVNIDQNEIYNMLYEGWECLKDDLQEMV